MKVSSPEHASSALGRAVVILAVVVLIVLVTVVFAVRTAAGSSLIEGRLTSHFGFPLLVARARIGWPYALVMEDVVSEGYDDGAAGLKAQEVRIGLSRRCGWAVSVRRAQLRLERNRDGVWEPGYFSRMAEAAFADVTDLARLDERIGPRGTLRLEAAQVAWRETGAATNVALMHGIDYTMVPVAVPGRPMRHHRLTIERCIGPGDRRQLDRHYEWMSSDTLPYIPIVSPEAQP